MAKKGSTRAHAARSDATLRDRSQPFDLGQALVEAFLTNERINQVLLDLLTPEV